MKAELKYQVLVECPYCECEEDLAYLDPLCMYCRERDAEIRFEFELCPQTALFIENKEE